MKSLLNNMAASIKLCQLCGNRSWIGLQWVGEKSVTGKQNNLPWQSVKDKFKLEGKGAGSLTAVISAGMA